MRPGGMTNTEVQPQGHSHETGWLKKREDWNIGGQEEQQDVASANGKPRRTIKRKVREIITRRPRGLLAYGQDL